MCSDTVSSIAHTEKHEKIAALPNSKPIAKLDSTLFLTFHRSVAILKPGSTMLQRLCQRLHIKEPGEQRGGMRVAMRR
jgi:hypothetical protein